MRRFCLLLGYGAYFLPLFALFCRFFLFFFLAELFNVLADEGIDPVAELAVDLDFFILDEHIVKLVG